MPEKFVEVVAFKGDAQFRYLVQSDKIMMATFVLQRRDPELDIRDATVVEYDGIVFAAPLISENQDAAEDTTEDQSHARINDEPTTGGESPKHTDEDFH